MLIIILVFAAILAVLAIAALTQNIFLGKLAVFATLCMTAFALVYAVVNLIMLIGGGY